MTINFLNHCNPIHDSNLPDKVKIVEVGPRDGLQNQPCHLSTQVRNEFVNSLCQTGISAVEVGSLVSAKRVPQMKNSDLLYQRIPKLDGKEYIMLVANETGLKRAIQCNVKRIAVFSSASEAFCRHNTGQTIRQNLDTIEKLCRTAHKFNLSIRGYVSCIASCPYDEPIQLKTIQTLVSKLAEWGCDEISLADTTGKGTAAQIKTILETNLQQIDKNMLAVHFHNTYGQALANILVALQAGIRVIDSSVSGLGGCPFAPGASGNVASEDVVYMLNGLGIETGINLKQLIQISHSISRQLNRTPDSYLARIIH